MKKINKVVLAAVAALAMIPASGVAYADSTASSYEKGLTELSELSNGKKTPDQLDLIISEWADYSGASKEDILSYEIAIVKGQHPVLPSGTTPGVEVNSGGGGETNLSNSAAGDYFYTDGGAFNHGHTGIYSSSILIVEAPGVHQIAHEIHAKSKNVRRGARIMRVKTTAANRTKAAKQSRKYIGRGYNAAFAFGNKDDKGGMNCSQLVWASWWYGAHIDLDTRLNDDIVWPRDLRDSTKAYVVKTL